MKKFLFAVVLAALSFLYWQGVAIVGFALVGGSVAPDAPPPSEAVLMAKSYGVIAVGILIYAGLIVAVGRRTLRR